MKAVAFIGAGLLILFGALMAIAATDPYKIGRASCRERV